jgi:CheY-like chemotaxis protein
VVGDPSRLRQVLLNLLNNAVKFTLQGRVAVEVALLSSEADHVVLGFGVEDTGIGIPAHRIEAMFEAFVQIDESTARRHGGTGLGLTICRNLVTLMGGRISARSEVGKGSRFEFSVRLGRADALPIADADGSPGTSSSEAFGRATDPQSERRPLQILLAEDNLVNQRVACVKLAKAGHEVTVAVTGREVLQWHAERPFDLILMDVQMPEMDGLEAARLIRQREGDTGEHILIVAVTANVMQGDAAQCLAAGMDAFIGKPVDWKKLQAVLEQHRPELTAPLAAT